MIVIRKADLSENVDECVEAVHHLDPMLIVESVNALARDSVLRLPGQSLTGRVCRRARPS